MFMCNCKQKLLSNKALRNQVDSTGSIIGYSFIFNLLIDTVKDNSMLGSLDIYQNQLISS